MRVRARRSVNGREKRQRFRVVMIHNSVMDQLWIRLQPRTHTHTPTRTYAQAHTHTRWQPKSSQATTSYSAVIPLSARCRGVSAGSFRMMACASEPRRKEGYGGAPGSVASAACAHCDLGHWGTGWGQDSGCGIGSALRWWGCHPGAQRLAFRSGAAAGVSAPQCPIRRRLCVTRPYTRSRRHATTTRTHAHPCTRTYLFDKVIGLANINQLAIDTNAHAGLHPAEA